MAATASEYNRVLAAGDPAALTPPRRRKRNAVLEAPFHAIEVRPGVTFTHAGLRVDQDGAVLTPDGPLSGLYAAGADIGGIYNGGYAGGLALATVFGLVAAESAVRVRTGSPLAKGSA
jgi:succinate dehydrogenase/fumarate reductase flavoprotein subunit